MTVQLQKDQTALAFDFGLARIGVATGNTLIGSASPIGIIHARTNRQRWAQIQKYIDEYQPHFFVVGVPLHVRGREKVTEWSQRCERFARQLSGRFARPAYLVHEGYSSVVVDQNDLYVDDQAAAVILQQFFDENL